MKLFSIILAILFFGLIVIIHELGHFLLAKANGIQVNEFCIGLGPTLFGFTKGETKYSIKLLPFGGACMMEGEDAESHNERAFNNKSVWARMSVVFCGPLFNFILAYILAVIVCAQVGMADPSPLVGEVSADSPAYDAGLQVNDVIVSINDETIDEFEDIGKVIQKTKGQTVGISYLHEGELVESEVTPILNAEDKRYIIGVTSGRLKYTFGQSLKAGFTMTKYFTTAVFKGLGMLISGEASPNDMSSVVGIVDMTSTNYANDVASSGVGDATINFIYIMAFISANLGVMNLLPLPALDGGRLVFLIVEAIRRKKIDPDKEGMVHFIGIVILMALMVLVMFNDIRKLFM